MSGDDISDFEVLIVQWGSIETGSDNFWRAARISFGTDPVFDHYQPAAKKIPDNEADR